MARDSFDFESSWEDGEEMWTPSRDEAAERMQSAQDATMECACGWFSTNEDEAQAEFDEHAHS